MQMIDNKIHFLFLLCFACLFVLNLKCFFFVFFFFFCLGEPTDDPTNQPTRSPTGMFPVFIFVWCDNLFFFFFLFIGNRLGGSKFLCVFCNYLCFFGLCVCKNKK